MLEMFWVGGDGSVQVATWTDEAPECKRSILAGANSAAYGAIAGVSKGYNETWVFWVSPNGSVESARCVEKSTTWERYSVAGAGSASTEAGITAYCREYASLNVYWVKPSGMVASTFTESTTWGPTYETNADAHPKSNIFAYGPKRGLEQFVWVGRDGKLNWQLWTGVWVTQKMEGEVAVQSRFALVTLDDNHADLYWITPTGAVKGSHQVEKSWGPVFEVAPSGSAKITGSLTAVSSGSGCMDVLWTKPDDCIQCATLDNGWHLSTFAAGNSPIGATSDGWTTPMAAISRRKGMKEVIFKPKGSDFSLASWVS